MTNVARTENPPQANGEAARSAYLLTIRRVRFDKREAGNFRDYFRLITDAGCDVLVVELDELNEQLLARINATGATYLTHTRLRG